MNNNSINNQLTQDLIDELLANLRLELETNLLNQSSLANTEIQEQQKSEIVLAAINFLNKNEIFFNPFFDTINIAISIADEKGHFVYINKRYTEIFGYQKDEMIGKHFAFLLKGEERERIIEMHETFFKNGSMQPLETKGEKKDGSHINILISSELFINLKEEKFRVTTIKDITKEKKLNESLITKNKLFDYSTELLSIIGYDGYFKLINPSWVKKLGWSIEELLSKPYIEFVHPDDVDRTNQANFIIVDGQEVLQFENRYICKDGSYKWLSWNAQPVPNDNIMVAVARDITDEKELEDALNTKNLIFEYSLDMLCIAGFDGYFKILNPVWETTLGWTLDELKSKLFTEFLHPEDVQSSINMIESISKGVELFQFENRYKCTDGSYKWISWNAHPILEKEILVCVARDVTSAKETAQKLTESEEKFKHLVEDSKAGVFILKDDKFIYVNQAMSTTFGYTREELYDKPLLDIIEPLDKLKIKKYTDKLLPNELFNNHLNFQGKTKKGEIIYIDIIGRVTHYETESVIIGSLIDVTEQTKHVNSLKKLETAIQQSHASIVITSIDGNIEFVNNAFLEVTGYSFEEVKGKNPRILKSGKTPFETYINLWETLWAKKTWQGVLCNKKKNGDLFWESATISPVANELGNIINFVAVKEDITHKIYEEEERKLLIEELTLANKELKQFSYITSHNMRAPLTNLIALDSLLDLSKITDKDTLEIISLIKRSTNQLNETLNDLIRILIIKEKTSIETKELVFEEIFIKTIYSIQTITNEADFEVDFSALPTIVFNEPYLESIFLNLITNAIKYAKPTIKPLIKISFQLIDGKYCLIISDNGMGLNMKRVGDKMFGLYQRFHNNEDGKGIGLYLVKSQVTALGGSIDFVSEVNIGTTFTICFNSAVQSK
jgi:PAS domain S-box-containing protein